MCRHLEIREREKEDYDYMHAGLRKFATLSAMGSPNEMEWRVRNHRPCVIALEKAEVHGVDVLVEEVEQRRQRVESRQGVRGPGEVEDVLLQDLLHLPLEDLHDRVDHRVHPVQGILDQVEQVTVLELKRKGKVGAFAHSMESCCSLLLGCPLSSFRTLVLQIRYPRVESHVRCCSGRIPSVYR